MRVNSIGLYTHPPFLSKNINFLGKEPQKEISRSIDWTTPTPDNSDVFPPTKPHFPLLKRGITRAVFITSNGDVKIPANRDGSYTINEETNTRAYYGRRAIDFLNLNKEFKNETQVVFPLGSTGTMIKDGKSFKIGENRGVLISKGAKVQIIPDKKSNYPYVLTTEKDYDWYGRFDKNSKKFSEALYYGAHAYNAEFSPNIFLDSSLKNSERLKKLGIKIKNVEEWNNLLNTLYGKYYQLNENEKANVKFVKGMMDKLWNADLLEYGYDKHIKFKKYYAPKYEERILREAKLNDSEMSAITPVFEQARNVKMHTKIALKQDASIYGDELVEKMKTRGVVANNKKDLEHVYWKKTYGNEVELITTLQENGFEKEDIEKITEGWKTNNLTQFDLSGLEYIDDDISVYSLDDKINNWTQQKTNWVTNSISTSSTKGIPPHVGVSLVQFNKPEITDIKNVRIGEALHRHPNEKDRKQYEIYLITRGRCALRVVPDELEAKEEIKNNEADDNKGVVILKEGDLVVLEPGIHHCVNLVEGVYEHICTQVPSVFHYGEYFKEQVQDNYSPEEVRLKAIELLRKGEEALAVNSKVNLS